LRTLAVGTPERCPEPPTDRVRHAIAAARGYRLLAHDVLIRVMTMVGMLVAAPVFVCTPIMIVTTSPGSCAKIVARL
jgi:hypothetical protein